MSMSDSLASLNVDDLVPHRRTMSWLDRVISVDTERVVAEADIRESSLFVRDGQMGVWVGIEYMAQTIAAWAGNRARSEGRSVALGFLVGTRRYDVHRQGFKVGDCLRIVATFEPVAAAIVAWVWLGEALIAVQILRGVVVLVGILLAETAR